MCKGLGITLAIFCLFYAPASLFAQNTPANLNYQSDLILKRAVLFEHDLGKPETMALMPVGLNSQTPAIRYEEFIAPLNRPIYPLIKNRELIYEYWQILKTQSTKTKQTTIKKIRNLKIDRNIFNALYNKPKVDEKKLIRLAWRKVFGVDVWYPYYKVKEVEDWVKERMSVRIYGFKGKPKFENDQILYVFKKTF